MQQLIAEASTVVSPAIQAVIEKLLRPAAVAIDRDATYPRAVMHALGAADAFAQLADGHSGLTNKVNLLPTITAITAVAQECGATAFCCWCQGALTWYLRCTTNQALRTALLTDLAHGVVLGGTALSNPMKVASGLENLMLKSQVVPKQHGWQVSGIIPWVSNIAAGHPFGAIFAVPDAPPVMACVDDTMLGLTIKDNDNFEVMAGTATVVAKFAKVSIAPSQVLATDADDFIKQVRPGFILLQAGIGLGLLEAAAQIMDASRRASSAGLPDGLLATPTQVRTIAASLYEKVLTQADLVARDAGPTASETMRLRLQLVNATIRAATAAQLMAGAAGLVRGRRPARLLREAAFYGVLTPSVRHLSYELASN